MTVERSYYSLDEVVAELIKILKSVDLLHNKNMFELRCYCFNYLEYNYKNIFLSDAQKIVYEAVTKWVLKQF